MISVIIPTYNRAAYLKKAVESVLCQTRKVDEILIVDDGSSDETQAVLTGYGPAVRCLHQENRGPAAARNLGIQESKGNLLAFLDSDDWFDPKKIAVQTAAMEADPDYLISHTQERWYRRGKHLNQKKRHRKEGGDIFTRSLDLCAVSPSTVMARRAFFDQAGLFDEQLPCCEDYDLWLRASVSIPFLLVDQVLTYKDGGRPDQVSAIYRLGMDKFRIASIEKLLADGGLSWEQEQAARRELIRKCEIYGSGCAKHGREDEAQYYLTVADSNRTLLQQKEWPLDKSGLFSPWR